MTTDTRCVCDGINRERSKKTSDRDRDRDRERSPFSNRPTDRFRFAAEPSRKHPANERGIASRSTLPPAALAVSIILFFFPSPDRSETDSTPSGFRRCCALRTAMKRGSRDEDEDDENNDASHPPRRTKTIRDDNKQQQRRRAAGSCAICERGKAIRRRRLRFDSF